RRRGAGPAFRLPERLVVLGRLPDGERGRVGLFVLVGIDARPPHARGRVETRESPVTRVRGDLEVERAAALVDVPALHQLSDQPRHVRYEVRGTRIVLGLLDAQRLNILEERVDVPARVVPERDTRCARGGDRVVIEVVQVHS